MYVPKSPERFYHLLSLVAPIIAKKNTNCQQAIPPGEHLSMAVQCLASGDPQQSLSYNYRAGETPVSNIIRETCEVI